MTSIWTKRRRVILGVIGLILVSAPVVGVRFLIEAHTRDAGTREVAELARESIVRAELAIDQGLTALSELSLLGVSRCSERDLDLMRRAVYANFSIKEVGIVNRAGQITCNHIGDVISVKRLSAPFASRNRSVTLQLVELGTSDRVGVMLVWSYGSDSGLSAIVPSPAIAPDFLPAAMRNSAIGRMTLSDGGLIGTVPDRHPPAAEVASSDLISALATSDRYPIRMSLAVPFATFWQESAGLLTYALIGGGLVSTLIFALFIYVLRAPTGAVAELGQAAARSEFIPYYQPVIDIPSGRLVGCEVLMRWQKPDGTILAPASFIRLAEVTGLAGPMTLSLMQRTRADLDEAFGRRPHLKIAINLFDGHFATLKTVRDVESIFGKARIAFDQLVFEVTERQPLANIKRARVVIKRLQDLGARVALDDAGAGHAGLAYLQQLGVDIIKIDKLFIDTIDKEHGSAPIVASLVKLGHDLGMEVIAEGVETFEQLEYLRSCGTDSAQGYLFSPPLPARAFLELVEAMEPLAREGAGLRKLPPATAAHITARVA